MRTYNHNLLDTCKKSSLSKDYFYNVAIEQRAELAQLRADLAAFTDLLVANNAASPADLGGVTASLRADLAAAQQRIASLEAKQENIDAAVDAVVLYDRIAALEAAVSEARYTMLEVLTFIESIPFYSDCRSANILRSWLAAHPAEPQEAQP